MSYIHTNYETGWNTNAWIENTLNSTYGFVDEFRCEKSGETLDREALFIKKTNFKHRGNETDELICYNRDSTPEKFLHVWKEWDDNREMRKEELQELADEYNIKIKIL